jgi:type IV pilus assembly protein PilV
MHPYKSSGMSEAIGGSRKDRGFSMLEVLISIFIILLGLLGLAGLIVRSNQTEMESYQRVQALMLVQDMVDRINANRKVATCYSTGGLGVSLGTGAGTIPTCGSGSAQEQKRADDDLAAWNSLLLGSAEAASTGVDCNATPASCFGAMVGAIGCINQIDAANNIYMVSVAWQGLAATAAPNSGNNCGQNQFGSEALRRVVTATVRIGALL